MRVWECDRHFLVIVGPGGSQHVLRLGCSVLNLSNTIVGHFLSEIEDNNRDGFMKLACSSFCIKETIHLGECHELALQATGKMH
jgi:hypothetical protein